MAESTRPLKICVLQSSYEGSNSCFKEVDDVRCDPSYYLQDPGYTWEHVQIHKQTAVQQIKELSKRGFDCFVNLCDGGFEEDRAGIEVVLALEKYNLPFTGASSVFYEPSKETMKLVAHSVGVKTPMFVFAYDDEGIEQAANTLDYPMIVKHFNGSGSIGMSKDSKVETKEKLFEMARIMIATYGGALIEEFIEGEEYSVLVAETENEGEVVAYQPVHCKFADGESFKHFDLKWVSFNTYTFEPLVNNPELEEKLKDLSKKVFVGLHGTGYGRTDIRVNHRGEAFLLEMNPNCGIFYDHANMGSADYILTYDPVGHAKFITHIIDVAIKRHKKNQRKYTLGFTRDLGYAVFASMNIAEGEVAIRREEKQFNLVSKGHVKRNWKDATRGTWFEKNWFPLSNDVWMMENLTAEDWTPVNHSCNPNCWFNGLNIVARRNIKKGEQLTVDYATWAAFPEFQCKCKSAECRGTIKPSDCLEDFVERIYGDNISDFVRTARINAAVSNNFSNNSNHVTKH